MLIKKIIKFLSLLLIFKSSYSMEPKIEISREEENLITKLKNATDKLTPKEREEFSNIFSDIRFKTNISKIIDEITKKFGGLATSKVVLLINNTSQKKPLMLLQAIVDKYESNRDNWAAKDTKNPNAKYQDINYKGEPFNLNTSGELSDSAYSIYLELPEELRKTLENLGYVKLKEAITKNEATIKYFLDNEYKKIPQDIHKKFDIKLLEISNILDKLNEFITNKEIVNKFISEVGTMSVRFILLRDIINNKNNTNKPFILTDKDTLLNLYNRFPEELRKGLEKNGYINIIL